MTHQQALDKLAARHLTESIHDDIARLVIETTYPYNSKLSRAELTNDLLERLLKRWNCILKADKTIVSDIYKQKTILAIAIILHKHGFADEKITNDAIKAIDALNKGVVLSDDFFRKSEEIKKMLSSPPPVLKRRPALPDSLTFYRPKDVISIQIDNKYCAAYIHKLAAPNESPILELYDAVFETLPTMEDLKNVPAWGQVYNDGISRVAKFSVYGIKYLPDLANQIQLIQACVDEVPDNRHLTKPVGLYSVNDLFDFQDIVSKIMNK